MEKMDGLEVSNYLEDKPEKRPEIGMKCPACDGVFELRLWELGYLYCEDCGGHPAMKCPKCEEQQDLIFHDPEVVRPEAG